MSVLIYLSIMKTRMNFYFFLLILCHYCIRSVKLDYQATLIINKGKDNQTDFASFTWNELKPINEAPLPRRGHSMIQTDNYIVIFGGCYMETDCYNDIHYYDIEHYQWYKVNATGQIPSPRQGHSATLFGTTMYIYGGSSNDGYLSDLYSFDLEQVLY